MGVDRRGALFYACDGLAVDPARSTSVSNALTPNSSITQIAFGSTVDALQLHSFPGANRVIYLDFTGHTTSGTAWNSSFTGGAPIVSQPFDLDGDPSSFSASERSVIQSVWQRVAEDYAPFAIDVTTQDPGVEALRRTDSSDQAFGIRVVLSPTNWYNSGAGGVGYIGSFNWNSDTPCFAFTSSLANHPKYIAEAAAHEAGHTVGLNHDGASGGGATEYYAGQGDWAPIMGVGYYKTITQFSKGEYPNANNTQDDFAVISSYAPLATDDVGNSLSTAKLLSGSSIADGGTIETRSDVDLFRFDTGGGNVSLSIVSPAPEANLHLQAELINSSGQVLLSSPVSSLTASFSSFLNAGTYYLRISGVGYGDAYSTGYTDYGSVGNYVITGTLVQTTFTKAAPVAMASVSKTAGTAPLTVSFTGSNSYDTDGSIVGYRWDFGNGDISNSANPTYTYANVGAYTATLTVTDNDGLTSSSSIGISVSAAANLAPVAVASADKTSGPAPLTVVFSPAGSYDPDGVIASYAWNFGDGSTSAEATPTKTYSVAGTYSARLTITDNAGATASSFVTISAGTDPANDVDVAQYGLSTTTAGNNGTSAVATVVVRNRQNLVVANAAVTIQWSGVVSNSTTARTDGNGVAVLTSKSTKRNGTITGVITSVAPATGGYDTQIYAEPTSRSVATR